VSDRILVADDDPDIVEAIRVNLETAGFEVHVAYNGFEAMEQARAVEPAVILLDVMMPGLDGFEVCRELRADPRTQDAAIVFLTAKTATRDEAMGLIAGADDYVVKPFDPADLLTRIQGALKPSGSRSAAPAASDAPTAKVLTVSDGVANGTRQDTAGAAVVERLNAGGFTVTEHRVVADGSDSVARALRELTLDYAGLVVTTGGTGFGPRDLTPEGTRLVIEREAPGLAEAMRAASNAGGHPFGMLSRGVCGSVGAALVCNLPGSSQGALECLGVILPALPHAIDLLAGRTVHEPGTP
jgi:molybdopterin adenylyltransferase